MAKFVLRELKADDMFPMFGILSKIGFKDLKEIMTPDKIKDITKAFNSDDEKKDDVDMSTVLGFNLVLEVAEIIMKNLPSCKTDLYKFLASVAGMSTKEIADLSMGDFAELVIEVIQKDEFKDFFKAVSKLFK